VIEYYKPIHFITEELVPQKVYEDRGEKALELLDVRALITLDSLRNSYGIIVVNNWHKGGNFNWCGLRTPDSPNYKSYSQHTFGRAFDCHFKNVNVDIIRNDILHNPDAFPYIMSIELGTSWLHFDVRNCDRIQTYYPT